MDWDFIDEMAIALGVKPAARQKWRLRGHVPYWARLPLIEMSAKRGRPLTPNDFGSSIPEHMRETG